MKKTISFAMVHMGVAFSIGFIMTGDFWVGSALALVEPLCNTVAYYFHEKLWLRITDNEVASYGVSGHLKAQGVYIAPHTSVAMSAKCINLRRCSSSVSLLPS